jgi:hypothetical protein
MVTWRKGVVGPTVLWRPMALKEGGRCAPGTLSSVWWKAERPVGVHAGVVCRQSVACVCWKQHELCMRVGSVVTSVAPHGSFALHESSTRFEGQRAAAFSCC